jgi:ABC-type multidrug transport system fused ATPase/permease subunit
VSAETWATVASPLVELAAAIGVAAAFSLAWSTRSEIELASTGTVLVALVLMYRPLHGLAQSVLGWWSGLASLDRIDELLALPAAKHVSDARPGASVRTVELRELCFDYGDRPVLQGINARFSAGQLVAVTGPSGSGKSTLLALIAGVLEADAGAVEIDGALTPARARTEITAWMPQTPALFRDTIIANIALGDDEPDRARVLEAASHAGLDFVNERTLGYDSVLREGGRDLSVGQRQRVTLARALYRDSPIVLLDEPTSALEKAREEHVLRVCRALADRGHIVIVATHRDDFLRYADHVLELRDSKVIAWDERATSLLLH